MANHKCRDIHYKGFIITLNYDAENYNWGYSLTSEITGMDYGSNNDPVSFKEAQNDAKQNVDNILAEIEEYTALQREEEEG